MPLFAVGRQLEEHFFGAFKEGNLVPSFFSWTMPASWFGDAKYYKIRGFGTRHLLGPERGRLRTTTCVTQKKTGNAPGK